MKFQTHILLSVISFAMIALSGCTQSKENAKTPSPLFNTARPMDSATFTPTAIPASPTSRPISTLTAIPTLVPEQAKTQLQVLLANNGNCNLPCFWGITPSSSTSQVAEVALKPLAGISETSVFQAEGGGITIINIENILKFYIHVAYFSDNQFVSRISFQITAQEKIIDNIYGEHWVDIFDSDLYHQHFHPYVISEILSKLGTPTAVAISTDGGRDRGKNIPGFYVLLYYPDQGLLASYTTSRQLVGKNVRGCLENAHVELELFPSNHADLFPEYLSKTKWAKLWPIPTNSPNWKPIEEATSMTVQQFYDTFRQPVGTCIETPANLWPIPEQ